uniref:DUF659 domain-containing protein n=1 Tax=Strigamia maritima TaxID=126957 RepID=T1IHQ2_STRMM
MVDDGKKLIESLLLRLLLPETLVRDIALFCARDLLPFNIVARKGFEDFCKKYRIIKKDESLPCRTTISRSALNDVYTWVREKFSKQIESISNGVGMTCDCWTDNYLHLAYMTYTIHWIDNDWNLKADHFSITTVTDCGSNMLKAFRLMKRFHIKCVAHGLHNLISRDLFQN